jgi:phage tail-like protein
MYRYLDPEWFTLNGLEWHDGVLTLARMPLVEGELAETATEAIGGAAGIAVDTDGNLYIADPVNHRILRHDACTGEVEPLRCFGGEGHLPGQLRTPRGVLVGPREALYVADSGNHRIQVVDLATLQIRAIWGQPGRLDTPVDLAADSSSHVYISDSGRVQKFNPDGRLVETFWQTMDAQSITPTDPTYLSTTIMDDGERLLVLDAASGMMLVYHLDGTFDVTTSAVWEEILTAHTDAIDHPQGLVFTGDRLYIGDADRDRLLVFDADGGFVGVVRGYHGPVAGLNIDSDGRLLLHTGTAALRLLPGEAFVESGSFVAGPVSIESRTVAWHRLRVDRPISPSGSSGIYAAPTTHFQLYTYTSDDPTPPTPLTNAVAPETVELAAHDQWRAVPPDADDTLILNRPGRYLWIGGRLQGDGTGSPFLGQFRVDYDHEGIIDLLPAIYKDTSVYLDRALALFESILGDTGALIDDLPLLFDAAATPKAWLGWLAGWLAFDLERRDALARAFSLYRRRGTADALADLLALYTGLSVRIEEPHQSLWSLGAVSTLGFDTMLAPSEAQGAVVGTTATLDASHLLDDDEYGASLLAGHHFVVQAYGPVEPATRARLEAVLVREKPAHTTYSLEIIEPGMRVGFQGRIGVDTIVGGPAPDLVLGDERHLGQDTVLPDQSSALGRNARVGRRTRLT